MTRKVGALCGSCGQGIIAAVEQGTRTGVATLNCPFCGSPVTFKVQASAWVRVPTGDDEDEAQEERAAQIRVQDRLRAARYS
jgi:hypothetical protein